MAVPDAHVPDSSEIVGLGTGVDSTGVSLLNAAWVDSKFPLGVGIRIGVVATEIRPVLPGPTVPLFNPFGPVPIAVGNG